MKLNLHKSLFNEVYFKHLFDYSHRFEVYMGSAGSGKSVAICNKLIIKGLQSKRRILVCRKYGTTLQNSVMQLFKDVLRNFKLYDMCDISDYNRLYILPNGTEIIFLPLDEETKLLSLQDISDIWVEEAFEISKDILDQLNLRMRSKLPNQQIFLSFNPINSHHFLYDFCEVNPPESFLYLKTTYKDNKFLPESYISALEEMLEKNPKKAQVYVLG